MVVISSGTFTADATGKLDVLGHDGYTFGVDGAKVRVFEKAYHVSLGSLLQCEHCLGLETEV